MHQEQSQTHPCRACGNPVAHDHAGDLFCSACQRARREYDPRHDPDFPETLLELLKAHPRRPLHVYRELGIEQCGLVAWRCVQIHIRRFRRHGHRIVGRYDGTYEYRGQRARRNGGGGHCRRRPS